MWKSLRATSGNHTPDVYDEGERLPAGLLHVLRGGVDGARQFRVRLSGLGGDYDVGAILRSPARTRSRRACCGSPRLAMPVKERMPT